MDQTVPTGSDQQIMDAINKMIGVTTNVTTPTIPSADLSLPTGQNLSDKWNEFLDRASKDPAILTYYKNALDKAVGDTTLAIQYIEKDYQTGTRQTADTLSATLEKLGLTSTGESQTLENTLNQRGIATTQTPSGGAEYAGGGEAATEVGNLRTSQNLRKEAEIRSAQQGIETAGLSREKGITTANQNLYNTASTLGKQKQQDITSEATGMNTAYLNQKAADAYSATQKQSSSGGSPSGAPPYKPDTVNQTVTYNGKTFKGNPGSEWSLA